MPVAIVTAAGRGIGAAIARRLHRDGYDLVLNSAGGSADALAEELGAIAVTGSVADADVLTKVVDAAVQRHGRVDVLVNNTGHAPKGPLLEIPDEDWHAGVELLLMNVVRTARLVTPLMQAQGGGSIVNISTFSAFEPDPAFPVSSVARAALGSFTHLFAREHAGDGVRMNTVLPGFVDSHPQSDELVGRIPAGRYARVDEIADVVAFLAGPGSTYVTGQGLRVDGGLTRSV